MSSTSNGATSSSPASTTVPETVGSRQDLVDDRDDDPGMIPGSKEREMTRRQMTLDEVEEMCDRYRRGETVARRRA